MTGHMRAGSAATGAAGLHTDLYELRMVEAYLRVAMTRPATFSLFIRRSAARPWYIALGVHRFLELLETFRYGPAELAFLRTIGIAEDTLDWLAEFRPSGQVWAVPDGTVVLADEPILEVTAPLPVAQLVETAAVNLVQLPTLIATKAARIAQAARGRGVVDFGFRRAHGLETGVEAALSAYIGAGAATSNVEAGRRYGIPVTGTMAHSFVQAFQSERDAFRVFAEHHPDNTVLLVDTYDTLHGVRNAIAVADELRSRGRRVQAVRLDSGPIEDLAREARRLLDEAGFTDTRILASGGVDEYAIDELVSAGAPIDAFGVGTALVVSADKPGLDIAYKLVAYDGRPVAKYSREKVLLPGPKQVFRDGGPHRDVLACRDERLPGTALLRPVWHDGEVADGFSLAAARRRVEDELSVLPPAWVFPARPDPPTPRVSDALRALDDKVRAEER
jgi:nicotinate phosphoribosyltransferase